MGLCPSFEMLSAGMYYLISIQKMTYLNSSSRFDIPQFQPPSNPPVASPLNPSIMGFVFNISPGILTVRDFSTGLL